MKQCLEWEPWVLRIAAVFERAGAPLFLVGGAVRNPLMGLPISDVDMCGPALPKEVLSLCEGTEVHAHLRAAHFGTVELHVAARDGSRHMAEYTTFREDSYRCGHQPSQVRFATELSVDSLRRDFSVNALYCPVWGGREIADPTGGLGHLRQGVLHTVTLDPDQVLRDDGLRILRAVRFQAELGLVPTESLLASAGRHISLLADIAPERLRDEFQKILMADFRYPTLARAVPASGSGLRTMHAIGAWEALFPGLAYDPLAVSALEGLPRQEGVTPVAARLALLFWQAEEGEFRKALQHYRFSNKEAEEAGHLLRTLRELARGSLSEFAAAQAGLSALAFGSGALRVLSQAADGDAARRLRAAARDSEALLERLLARKAPFSLRELTVNGTDLAPLLPETGHPAKAMGELLMFLWQETVEGRIMNDKPSLLAASRCWLIRKQPSSQSRGLEESAALQQGPTVL